MARPVHDLQREFVARLTAGDGTASPQLRRAAFDNADLDSRIGDLVEAVAVRPGSVTEHHFADASNSGLSEDQVWELVICAAAGQADRQFQSGLAALEGALRGQDDS